MSNKASAKAANRLRTSIVSRAVTLLCAVSSTGFMCACGGDNDRLEPYIPKIDIADLMEERDSGKKIIFVDTREPEEYRESHLPDAINIPLRIVGRIALEELREADYIIPYCLKDFRGFEVAKALKRAGLQNVALLHPSGLNGWNSSQWANTQPATTIFSPNK